MANALNFNVKDYSDRIVFNETTGIQTAGNMTGWGGTNEATSDAISARLLIGVPGNTDLLEFDLYPDFPSSSTGVLKTFTAAQLGINKIYGGVYKFIYEVVTGTQTLTKTLYFFFKAYTQQWLDNAVVGLDLSKVGNLDSSITGAPNNTWSNEFQKVSQLWMLFEWAKRLACKNYVNDAQCIMNYINSKIKCV